MHRFVGYAVRTVSAAKGTHSVPLETSVWDKKQQTHALIYQSQSAGSDIMAYPEPVARSP
jgi:hypothetical protein